MASASTESIKLHLISQIASLNDATVLSQLEKTPFPHLLMRLITLLAKAIRPFYLLFPLVKSNQSRFASWGKTKLAKLKELMALFVITDINIEDVIDAYAETDTHQLGLLWKIA